ncbi:hypothetical protein AcW2_000633 [Taiwanofungus camphoratus]|nr:hypothetical protein AcW2_000633 [Antrodia cinnamomea]
MAFLNLPAVPPDLKTVSPYLQRADELSSKDPVMSYWCAYYAAQVGIALKPKDPSSRNFLFSLLGALEHLKKDIGPTDAIDDESASSAYVDNFALKVFAMADNEDRRGAATRGTAKKFLAAANFLELLRIFEKDRDLAADTSSEDKIRYAKWKAADIAKAFREGRKPTPGPAGSSPVPEPVPDTALPSSSSQRSVSPSAPAFTRDTPPPHLGDMPSPQQDGFFQNAPAQSHLLPNGVQSPGSWSTAATPGTPGRVFSGDDVNARARNGPRTARVSGVLEGWEDEYGADASADEHTTAPKNVRFAPAEQESDPFGVHATPTPPAHVAQLPLVDASAPPPAAPESGLPRGFVPEIIAPGPGAPPLDDLPDGFVPAPSPPRSYPSTPPLPSPPFPPSALPSPSYSPPSAPSFRLPSAPLVPPPAPLVPPPVLPPEAATVTEMPVELTPAVVARAQKHCRFAISALDYEDTEQARKELRAALRLLGG